MLHPKVKEFKVFMDGRPDLKRAVRERRTTLQALFEKWYESGDVELAKENESSKERKTDFQTEDWSMKLTKVLSLFEGMKWDSILADVQGMLEMAQIYLADLAEQNQKKNT
ncbi:spore coat protein YlbD [Pseudobacillus wudalianchiensis]|uniref:Uncharacterized protein n=1 Tax=Pseudobacillus wudalianchiensis TaxID=1743143 RepID=A0A1B9AJG0_9BACI|nr:spore coat protein YlbD [Bacillus wudalianchiensis]OCA83938.1 hypothetical protein A8F95_13265 [Bacillus wudalianchiensis]